MADATLVGAVMDRLPPQSQLSTVAVEAVLETLTQMGALALPRSNRDIRSPSSHAPGSTGDEPAMVMAYQEYLSLNASERRELVLAVQRRHQNWIARELEAHQAAWVLVVNGRVIESSPTLDDYPAPERLMELGVECSRIPFVFTRQPFFEEVPWSSLAGDDFYPTVRLTIAPDNWGHAQSVSQGRSLTADFDTGSPYLFVDWDWVISERLVKQTPVDFPQTWRHLGREYIYYTRSLRVGVTDEKGQTRSLLLACECVEDWRESPLCEVNPTRSALAGRNLLLKLPLHVELDGAARITRIRCS